MTRCVMDTSCPPFLQALWGTPALLISGLQGHPELPLPLQVDGGSRAGSTARQVF